MTIDDLNRELAVALGLPRNCTRAVLTLQVGAPPRLEVTVLCATPFLLPPTQEAPPPDASAAKRIGSVQFMLRLEPFPEQKT